MTNEQLKQQAIDAINALFNDTSVSLEKALENMLDCQSEAQKLANALRGDILRNGT